MLPWRKAALLAPLLIPHLIAAAAHDVSRWLLRRIERYYSS